MKTPPPKPGTKAAQSAEKAARLTKALRANLKRRKAQGKARDGQTPGADEQGTQD